LKFTDPLAAARLYLKLNPNEEENCALRNLLQAIADAQGTLHAPDALLFCGELGELTAALLDAMQQGRYSADEWHGFLAKENPAEAQSG
jgi:hypothetical protein